MTSPFFISSNIRDDAASEEICPSCKELLSKHKPAQLKKCALTELEKTGSPYYRT